MATITNQQFQSSSSAQPGGPQYYSPVMRTEGEGQEVIRFQEWMELRGVSTTGDVIQPARQWIAGSAFPLFHLKCQVPYISNCTLVLESSQSVEGPWTSAATIGATGMILVALSSEGGMNKFSNYLRWRLNPAALEWGICFQIKAFPGKSVAEPVMGPMRV